MKNTALVSLLITSPAALATTVCPDVPQAVAQEAAAASACGIALVTHPCAWA